MDLGGVNDASDDIAIAENEFSTVFSGIIDRIGGSSGFSGDLSGVQPKACKKACSDMKELNFSGVIKGLSDLSKAEAVLAEVVRRLIPKLL